MNQTVTLVENSAELQLLCQGLCKQAESGSLALALDTEFWREQTYWPVLCLVQLATRGHVYIIDALACDITPLRDVLSHPQAVKVLHASDQDCEIFLHQLGILPAPLFDTQIAARILGFQRQIGYANLVKELLNVDIDKSNQHTDWRKRPLNDAKRHYAAQDVVHLLTVYEVLAERMSTEVNLINQLHESQNQMLEGLMRAQNPEHIWRRWDNHRYEDSARERLKFLATFREKRAQELNVPRSFIFKDEALMSLVNNPPQTIKQLERVGGLGKHFPQKTDFMNQLKPYLES